MFEYLFIAFLVIFSVQIIYYVFIFGSFAFRKKKLITSNFNEAVSVIICAKNEAENLKAHIPYFLNQNYPNFELVLINDNSHDTTLEVIEEFQKKFPLKISVVNVAPNEQFWGNKKYALTLGIKAASHEHLLFSDADCKPISKNWITSMVQQFGDMKQLVLGYGSYEKKEKSLLNQLIQYETLLTAIQYFSFAKIGMPYMGVGRNIAYTKSLFFKAKGFIKHMNVKSGDDDLFVNQVATKMNTAICDSKDSFTTSTAKTSFKNWISQKRRHISTASHYKPLHKLLLGLFYFSQLSFWFLSVLLLSFLYKWEVVVTLVLIRFAMQFLVIGFSAKKLNEKNLVLFLPFYEVFLISIQMFIFIKNLISKPSHW